MVAPQRFARPARSQEKEMISTGGEKSSRKCHNASQYGIACAVLKFSIPCSPARFSPCTVEGT